MSDGKIKRPSKFDSFEHIFIIGPLTLDSFSNRAYIVSSTEIQFTPDEFDTLQILAAREDVPFTFDQLYSAVWEQDDGRDRRNEAREGIANIIRHINNAGNGFIWIEAEPSTGFTLRTRWAHNREKWQETRNDQN